MDPPPVILHEGLLLRADGVVALWRMIGTALSREGGVVAGASLAQGFRETERGGHPQESSDLLVSGWPFLRDGCLSLFISILKKGGALTDVGTLGAPRGSSGSQHRHLRLPICSWPAASLVRCSQRLRSPRPAPPWSSLWARSILFCLAHLLIL